LNSNIDLGGGGNTFADISLDPTELSHHSVEEQKVVGAHPNSRPTEVDAFEPVKHVNILLQVHLTNQAGENNENRRLSGSKAVDHYSWLFWVGESGEAVDKMDTVGHRNTEVGPVGTEDELDPKSRLALNLQTKGDRLISGDGGLRNERH